MIKPISIEYGKPPQDTEDKLEVLRHKINEIIEVVNGRSNTRNKN